MLQCTHIQQNNKNKLKNKSLQEIKGEISLNTITAGDFNTALSLIGH
jgi:hypothetical protein